MPTPDQQFLQNLTTEQAQNILNYISQKYMILERPKNCDNRGVKTEKRRGQTDFRHTRNMG